jgi:hypothetical protein
LLYLDEDMRHRFLVIYEASGMNGEMQTYLIRTLLSEGRLKYQTAESTKEGVKPRLLELEGPTGLIVTTTATRLHNENETRLFSLLVTDSREQTKNILRALANEDREPVDMDKWCALQTWLEDQPTEVTIPYANTLAEMVPPVAVRLRRDFGAILGLIKAHAILHQAGRPTDDKGRIVATMDDYRVVYELVADIVAEGVEAGVSETVRETVNAVKKLTEAEGAKATDNGETYTSTKQVAAELKIDRSAAQRRIKNALDGGYLKNLETRPKQAAKLAIGDPMPAKQRVMPEPELLCTEHFGEDLCTCATCAEGGGGSSKTDSGLVQIGGCTRMQMLHKSDDNLNKTPEKPQDNDTTVAAREENGAQNPEKSEFSEKLLDPPGSNAQVHKSPKLASKDAADEGVHKQMHKSVHKSNGITGQWGQVTASGGVDVQPLNGSTDKHAQAVLGILVRKFGKQAKVHPDEWEAAALEHGMTRGQFKEGKTYLDRTGRVGYHMADRYEDSYYYLNEEL